MNNPKTDKKRDEVLFALHKECTNPTAEQIMDWVKRFPQYADDIRSHAAIIKDWVARETLPVLEPSEDLVSRSQSRAMNALYKAQTNTVPETSDEDATFEQLMSSRGTDVPALAREIDISRGILAALVGGRMLPPAGDRLAEALMSYLDITRNIFNNAHEAACVTPRLGHAKAKSTPNVIACSYEELIRASSMPNERKQYWLGED